MIRSQFFDIKQSCVFQFTKIRTLELFWSQSKCGKGIGNTETSHLTYNDEKEKKVGAVILICKTQNFMM